MSLESRCEHAFDNAERFRGKHYLHQSRAWLEDVWEDGARGAVQGEGRHTYRVEVSWLDADVGVLGVDCTCSRYREYGVFCEHLWAILLVLDQEKLSQEVPGTGMLDLEDLMVGSYPGDTEEVPKPAVPEPPSTWQARIEAVRNWTQREAAAGRASGGRRRQLWLALDRDQVSATEELEVWFYCRDWLKSGKLGKLKPATLGRHDLDRFDREDRETLRFLLGLGLSGASGLYDSFRSYYDPGSYKEKLRSVAISQMFLEEAFTRLCGTGRFGWLSKDRSEVEPLELLPGAWRWGLRLEEVDGGLRLGGALTRASDESAPPPADFGNNILLESGWLLYANAVARLENGPRIYPWAQMINVHGPMEIPREEEAEAMQALLGQAELPPLELPERMRLQEPAEEPVPRLRLESRQGLFIGKIAFLYGESAVSPYEKATHWFDQTTGRVGFRQPDSERRILEAFAEIEPRIPMGDQEVVLPEEFFVEAVRQLHAQSWRVEVDHRPVLLSEGFTGEVGSGINWFDLSGRMHFGASKVGLPRLLAAIRKKKRYVLLDDGSMGLLPEEWLVRFGSLSGMVGQVEGESLRFELPQGFLLDALLADEEGVELDTTFAELRQRIRSAGEIEPAAAPETLQGTLRPYQAEGLGWIGWLSELGLGGCLADDMGLGKTIQVLAFLEEGRLAGEMEEGWSLLVVPRSLLGNWVAEGQRFTPGLPMHIYHGPGRHEALDTLREKGRPMVLVTTYGTLRRDIETLRETEYATVVLDEAQAIKNADSQTAKACRLVKARRRLALTGTPVENHLGELWSLFEFLNPGMLGQLPSLSRFAGERTLSPEALELVARALRPLILRRTKQQVLKDLPQKTEQVLTCELSTRERKRYDELLDHYRAKLGSKVASVGLGRSKMQVLEALLRLRQAACHPALLDPSLADASSAKLEVLMDRLDEVVEAGGKALVFSQFTKLLALARRQLDRRKLPYEYLDGRTRKREEKVERFQTDPECPLFLISLKAGGVGLNLTAASYVFLLDPWWNPAVESQAIDRAHRIGQEQPVFAYRLIAKDTVEEKILRLQAAKRELADAILAQDRRLLGQMTAEDLELLLGGPLGTS